MATPDPDKARSRFLNALRRISNGLDTQRDRIVQRTANAPRLHAGTPEEIVVLTEEAGSDNDLDYYVYELARLQDIAREVNKTFGNPQEIVDALAAFDRALPNLRRIRNPLTHIDDTPRLDNVAWFDSLVVLEPGGSVTYLVDPRYQDHDAAKELGDALTAYLRSGLRSSIAANPVSQVIPQGGTN